MTFFKRILTRLNSVRVYDKYSHTYEVYPVFDSREGIAPFRELYLEATLVTKPGALAHFRAEEPVFIARLLRRCMFYRLAIFVVYHYIGLLYCT